MELYLASFLAAVPGGVQGGPGYYLPAHLEEGGHRESYVFAEHMDHPLMVQTRELYSFLWTNRNMCNSANLSWDTWITF